jgi:hypothetical protein
MNLESGQEESEAGSIWNSVEAKFVAQLAKSVKVQLERRNEKKSVGILTFYNRQKTMICQELRQLNVRYSDDKKDTNEKDVIVVKSVDGFQVKLENFVDFNIFQNKLKYFCY